jgi:uncharacterized Zn finger protein (UPF0148 family)
MRDEIITDTWPARTIDGLICCPSCGRRFDPDKEEADEATQLDAR